MENKIKVMCFGTFDHLHKGHISYLKQAKKLGDELYVVIARDDTVKEVKGFFPDNNEEERKRLVQELDFVKQAFIGSKVDKYSLLISLNPDFICLGYDQRFFVDKLGEVIKIHNLKSKIVRLESFMPSLYKSSIIRESKFFMSKRNF